MLDDRVRRFDRLRGRGAVAEEQHPGLAADREGKELERRLRAANPITPESAEDHEPPGVHHPALAQVRELDFGERDVDEVGNLVVEAAAFGVRSAHPDREVDISFG